MSVPQITIFLDDSGQVRAESPGSNGQRLKVDLPLGFLKSNPEIASELYRQRDIERTRTSLALRKLQNQNIQTSASNHGPSFAKKIWHDAELVFSRAMQRKLTGDKPVQRGSAPGAKPTKPTNSAPILNLEL